MADHTQRPLIELHKHVPGHHREHVVVDEAGLAELQRAFRECGVKNWMKPTVTSLPIYVKGEDLQPCPCYVRWPR